MMRQRLRFDELYDYARERGMYAELLVSPNQLGEKGREARALVAVRVTDKNRRTLVARTISQHTSIDTAATGCLQFFGAAR